MADGVLTRADPPSGARESWRGLPISLRIGILYLLCRVVTSVFFLVAAELSGPTSRFGAKPSIGDFAIGWDAQWYWYVAVNGYPSELPLTEAGQVAENQWAFMPVYAYLAQVLGLPFHSWGAAAVLISLIAGYFACLVLYRLLRLRLDEVAATWAVLFFASAPLAALFQIGYAESLFLLLLFLSLNAVMRRKYGWLYLLLPLMGYTRPGVLAFALLLGLHGIQRWLARARDPLPRRHVAHIVALGALAVAVGFSWQAVAAVATGDPSAYLETELAWRRNWLPQPVAHFVPLEGFIEAAAFWFQSWGLGAVTGKIALALAVAAVAALLVFDRRVRALGPEIRLWSASYLVYLLLVFFPQSSVFRLLVPLSPLWGAAAVPRSLSWRLSVLGACLLGQWWWIYNMYALGNTYWQIP
ncbi:MAG: hypothetical protein QM611_09860 [Microbacterium sp.]|uniref:hypothetical protein n=1 Tax=Microbacterium sp. TaxID=51671 RepID=UPI0039E62981